MKKICKNCGKELPQDSDFCQYCGSNEIETIEDKPIVFKRCADCGKKLPDDSDFCQYCGSKNIDLVTQNEPNEVKNDENKTVYKRCIDCGKELPQDSEFCQYCGSKRVAIVNNNQVVKKENITNKKSVDDSKNKNTYKILFFVTLSIALFGILGILTLYENTKSELDSSLETIQTLEKQLKSKETELSTARSNTLKYQTEASKYGQVLNYAKKSKGYNDFYARQTLLYKPNNTKVWIYFGHYSTVSCQASSSDVSAEWGDWSGFWIPLTISYSGTGVEYIKLNNDANSEVFYITIVG